MTSRAFDREQKKFDNAIKVHGTILQLKAEEDEKKRLKNERRQNKLKQIEKEAKQRMNQLMDSLDKQESKRKQVLEKKEELERLQAKEQQDLERTLQERMKRFERQQKRREMALSETKQNGFRIRDKERRRHSAERLIKETSDAESCQKTLTSLKDKLDLSFSKSTEFSQRRVDRNKQHTEKVEATLHQSLMAEQRRIEEQLLRVIDKVKVSDSKKNTKETKYKEKGFEVSHELTDKFSKHSQMYSSYQREIQQKADEILERRQKKEQLKKQIFKNLDRTIARRTEKNHLRLQDQAENYGRALMEREKSKQRVLDKHRRLKEVAEQLSYEKSTLANKSVRNTLRLQRLRTAGTPVNDMRYRSLSSSISMEPVEIQSIN